MKKKTNQHEHDRIALEKLGRIWMDSHEHK